MKALIIVLNKVEYLDEILQQFALLNVKGATILDSQGMASKMASSDITSMPLFGSMKMLMKERHPYSKTIFTVIKNPEVLTKAIQEVKNVLSDEKEPGVGFMFTLPVDEIFLFNESDGIQGFLNQY